MLIGIGYHIGIMDMNNLEGPGVRGESRGKQCVYEHGIEERGHWQIGSGGAFTR